MVVTNGIEFTELVELGYLVPLDHSKLPNFAKYAAPIYKNESFDPGNRYCVPYVTGYTGVAYNPKYVKDPITGIADLWNPKYKGKVGMMSDVQEIGNFGMMLNGVDPEKSTPKDWADRGGQAQAAAQRGDRAQVLRPGLCEGLDAGDIWITMAWSGDMFQRERDQRDELSVHHPEGGGHDLDRQPDDPKGARIRSTRSC